MGVIKSTLGTLKWTPPDWAKRLGAGKIFGLMALLAIAVAAFTYYKSLPVPPTVTATATAPALSPVVRDVAQPQPVYVDFSIKTDPRKPVEGALAIARVDLIRSALSSGVKLTPNLPGTWEWLSDTRLRFNPEQDWPAGERYTVSFETSIFAPGLNFERMSTTFTTPSFAASISDLKFYQDPRSNKERKIVATLNFSHTIESAQLEKALALVMRKDGQTIKDAPTDLSFKVTTDKSRRTAYVHSQNLEIPEQETFAKLTLDNQFTSEDSKQRLDTRLEQKVRIPDVSTYFRVENTQFLLARDANDEPQQTVTLAFTDRVNTNSLNKKLSVYRLPSTVRVNGKVTSKSYWESAREVTPDILSQSELIEFALNPLDNESNALHSLRLDTQTGFYYYLRVEKGLRSDGNFVLSTPYDTLFYASPYPEEVNIAQDGAVLPLTGSHKVHFVSRGVKALKVEIGRLLESDVNHLASQIDGDIKDARFSNYRFNQDNLTERDVRYITLPSAHPKKASYAHLDLSDYLEKGGYYFVRVSGWNTQGGYETGSSDQRLVLITDLGFVAKVGASGQQDLFVHSLATGRPVAGAKVSLLGKNGLPVLSATTSGDGHARMPTANEFKREKTPTVYVVQNGSDAVFMPYGRYTRQLDFSRFDTSGEYTANNGNQLKAQLFTERDLFRPGDKVHVAAIIKRGNWRPLDRLPLKLLITDPRGQLVLEKTLKLPADGFVEHTLQTDSGFHTGNYEIALYTLEQSNRRRYLGGHQFKVEEFQPDRLRIASRISNQKSVGWIQPSKLESDEAKASGLKVHVQLDNLFGTPASDRRVQGNLVLRPARMYFSDYPDFIFTDPLRRENVAAQTVERALPPTKTDRSGAASLDLNLTQFDKGIYELSVYTEGFEAGAGRSVKSRARVMVSPLDYLVGYKASNSLDFIQKQATATLEFLALNSDAKRVKLDKLVLKLYEVKFVSTLVKQSDGTFAYQSISKDTLVNEQSYAIANEGSTYALPTDTSGRFVMQISDSAGNVYSRVPYVVAGARNLAGNLEQNAELDLSLDKASYSPGEYIDVQISAPYNGTGLITIERDSVLAYQWFQTSTTSSTQRIRIPDNLEGNAYVNVTFMRGLDSKEIYLNPLSYALKSFSIKRDARTVVTTLKAPKKVAPGDRLNIQYTTNKPSRIVIFAVDAGILQVANYQQPKPLDFFLAKRALRVTTYQIADLVLPEFITPSNFAAPGGGEAAGSPGKNLNPFKRKTDAPVVFWSGLLDSGPSANTVSYDVPDYFNGELSIMAVAVAEDAVGEARIKTLVRGPFVLSPNVPTSVAPGDEFNVSVGVANNIEGSGAQASIEVGLTHSDHLSIVGDATTTLTIGEGEENHAVFRIRANDAAGSASLTFKAATKSVTAQLASALSVRPATPFVTTVQSAAHSGSPINIALPRKLRQELASNTLTASVSPIVLANGLQQYLDEFPHACAEQIVSKVFPQLGLYGQDASFDDAKFRNQFDELIGKLRTRQLPNGGFRFWQASTDAAEFPSVYISHFLTEAKEADLPVPQAMLQSAQTYLRAIASRATHSEEQARLHAYAIYVLTRNGAVTTNYLTSLQEYLQAQGNHWKKDVTAVYMAASYRLIKLEQLALELISGYVIQGNNKVFSDFDTHLSRDAQYVFLLAKHFPDKLSTLELTQITKLVAPVLQNRFNTLSSAYTILALHAYGDAVADTPGGSTRLSIKDASGRLMAPAAAIASATIDATRAPVSITGNEGKTVFTSLSQTGFEQTPSVDATAQGLEIDRKYLNAEGAPVSQAILGEELRVRLRIRSTGKTRTNVAVVDLLPGGFEVQPSSLRRQYNGWTSDYVDVREDRVVVYGSFGDRLTEISYTVKATASGTFAVPAAYANSMYDRSVQAHTATSQIVVKPPTP